MSSLTLRGNAGGSGTFILESANSNTNRTIVLPDSSTTLVGTDSSQVLTNKTINGGTISVGTSQTTLSGTLIDFTGIPSWTRKISVILAGVSTSGTANLLIQVGNSAFVTTGYVSTAHSSTNAPQTATNGFLLTGGVGATGLYSPILTLYNIAGNQWVAGLSGHIATGGALYGGGQITLGGILDRIRLTTANGTDTFDAGLVNIMWEG